MTITFETESGSLLPSTSSARRFWATEELRFACVRFFDPRRPEIKVPEEVVFRDGAFVYPYSIASKREGNRYTVVRQGGWHQNLELLAEDKEPSTPIPAGGQTWGGIYEVDYTTLPSQAIGAPGPYQIDGLTWWLKGNLANPGGVVASARVVNGSGLGLRANFGVAYTGPGMSPNPYLRWFMPLAQIEGFNPAAPVALQYRLACSINNRETMGGLIDCTNDTVGPTSAQRLHTTAMGGLTDSNNFPGAAQAFGFIDDNSDNPQQSSNRVGSPYGTLDDWLMTVILAAPDRALCSMNRWLGTYPDVWSTPQPPNITGSTATASTLGVHAKATSAPPQNLGMTFFYRDQTGGSSPDYWLRTLRVCQPKVTA